MYKPCDVVQTHCIINKYVFNHTGVTHMNFILSYPLLSNVYMFMSSTSMFIMNGSSVHSSQPLVNSLVTRCHYMYRQSYMKKIHTLEIVGRHSERQLQVAVAILD